MFGLKPLFEKARRNASQKPYRVIAHLFIDGQPVKEIPFDVNAWSKSKAKETFNGKVELRVTEVRRLKVNR